MFNTRHINYLESQINKKDAEISRLNETVRELIDKFVFNENPQRLALNRIERLEMSKETDDKPDLEPKDAYSVAIKAAEAKTLENLGKQEE